MFARLRPLAAALPAATLTALSFRMRCDESTSTREDHRLGSFVVRCSLPSSYYDRLDTVHHVLYVLDDGEGELFVRVSDAVRLGHRAADMAGRTCTASTRTLSPCFTAQRGPK